MLKAEQLKPFLGHEDRFVRKAVAEFFADGWSRDPDVFSLILDAAEQYRDFEIIDRRVYLEPEAINPASFQRLLAFFVEVDDEWAIARFNESLCRLPAGLLVAFLDELEHHPRITPKALAAVRQTCEVAGWSGEQLWQELRDEADRCKNDYYNETIDDDRIQSLIDALALHGVPDDETLYGLLRSLEPEEGWLEIFLVQLAGTRRIRQAVPILVDKLRIDADYLLEETITALIRIGDPSAVDLISANYFSAPDSFQSYACSVLGDLKDEQSEQAIFEILETETDVTLRTLLCDSLCRLFSERGVEVVLRQIEAGYNTMMITLEHELLPVAEVLGIELPQAEKWKRERDEGEARYARILESDPFANQELKAGIARGIGQDLTLSSERVLPPQPSIEPIQPIRNTEARIGRNDPCPCGSGKKFKKCCSRG